MNVESTRNVASHLTLHRYFLNASRNRSLFLQKLQADEEEHLHTQVHLDLWYACLVGSDAFFFSRRDQLLALAGRHAVPSIYAWGEFPAAGGLISYGTSVRAYFRQQGVYAGKILKGAKPAAPPR